MPCLAQHSLEEVSSCMPSFKSHNTCPDRLRPMKSMLDQGQWQERWLLTLVKTLKSHHDPTSISWTLHSVLQRNCPTIIVCTMQTEHVSHVHADRVLLVTPPLQQPLQRTIVRSFSPASGPSIGGTNITLQVESFSSSNLAYGGDAVPSGMMLIQRRHMRPLLCWSCPASSCSTRAAL